MYENAFTTILTHHVTPDGKDVQKKTTVIEPSKKGTLAGVAAGAALGSAVPVVGTATGALVGGVVGFIFGPTD